MEGRNVLTVHVDRSRSRSHTIHSSRAAHDADRDEAVVLTTEFYAMIAGIVGVLVAAQQADNLDAPLAWTLAAAIAVGYILSRGIAKAGSAYRDHEQDH
jgi:uncharacterized membrane protein